MCANMRVLICVCEYVCANVCAHVCVCVCVLICVCANMCAKYVFDMCANMPNMCMF